MPARFRTIIRQQSPSIVIQHFLIVILRAKRLCCCQTILNNSRHLHGFHQTVAGKCSCYPLSDLVTTKLPKNRSCQICLLHTSSLIPLYRKVRRPCFEAPCFETIFYLAEFSARSDIFFCLKINWRRVGVKRKYHSARKIPPSGKRP